MREAWQLPVFPWDQPRLLPDPGNYFYYAHTSGPLEDSVTYHQRAMPPKAKRSKSPDSQFLFVNEDASTVTRTTKDAELDRTKQSHVQRQNFARKRRLRDHSISAPQTSSQSSVSPSPVVAGPSTGASSISLEAPAHSASFFDILQNLDPTDPLIQSTSPQPHTQDPLDPRLSALFSNPFASTTPSPALHTPQGHIFDPSHSYRTGHFFDAPSPGYPISPPPRVPANLASPPMPLSGVSTPLAINRRLLEQWAPPLIRHYNTVILPEKFWRDTQKVSLGQIRHATSIHADMQACMAEPAHMYSFLASAAAQMLAREGRFLIPDVSEEDSQRVPTFFKTKAIQALRAKLAVGQLNHNVAVDIHRLYAAAVHSDNYEAAEPHFQVLLSMVEALGGMSTFGDYHLEALIILDCSAALKQLAVPRLLATWDPGPIPEETFLSLAGHSQHHFQPGSMMEAMFYSFENSDVLVETFADLIQVLKLSAYLNSNRQYLPEQYKWFNWRTLTILHRLLSMPLHIEMDDKTDSVRIATAFWTSLLHAPAMGQRTSSRAAHILRTKLENTDLGYLWQPRPECLLWVAVFGGICCGDEVNRGWYVNLAKGAAAEVGVRNLRELEELFVTLLYEPLSQRDLLVQFATLMWPVVNP